MTEMIIFFAIIAGLWLIASAIVLEGIYWTHYPYGRKRRRRQR